MASRLTSRPETPEEELTAKLRNRGVLTLPLAVVQDNEINGKS